MMKTKYIYDESDTYTNSSTEINIKNLILIMIFFMCQSIFNHILLY